MTPSVPEDTESFSKYTFSRRDALRYGFFTAVFAGARPRQAFASPGAPLQLRRVTPADCETISRLMSSCVANDRSFHGKCEPWSIRWAEVLVKRRPESLILEREGVAHGFVELPKRRAEIKPLSAGASKAERGSYEAKKRLRRTFWLQAVGIDSDLLRGREAVDEFLILLVRGAERALELGFTDVECYLPWARHPKLTLAWEDIPGVVETQVASVDQVSGRFTHHYRIRLAEFATHLRGKSIGFDDVILSL